MSDEREYLSALRAYVVRLAYRMLGSAADAEEVAQEALLRLGTAEPGSVLEPRAWLTRTATRLCINQLKSAARTRTTPMGDDLPEPLLAGAEDDETFDDTLSMALITTVQRLRPAERAVFLLHDVFAHPFDEVASILDLRVENCRQLAVRARSHLRIDEVRSDASPETIEQLTEAFFAAIDSGETDRLGELLGEEVVLRSAGGGRAPAAKGPIVGREAVLRFLERVLVTVRPNPVAHRRRVWFNGARGVVVTDAEGRPQTAFQFLVQGGRIVAIFAQRDPQKLVGLA